MGFLSFFHSTWFDVVLLVIIGASVVASFFRGFIKEAVSLVSWIVAIILALKFSPVVSEKLLSWLPTSVVAYMSAFILIIIIVLIVGMVISKCIKIVATITGLGIVDKILGSVFGLVRGVLVASLIIMLINLTSFASSAWFKDSAMKTVLKRPEAWLQHFIPLEVGDVHDWAGEHKDHVKQTAINSMSDIV